MKIFTTAILTVLLSGAAFAQLSVDIQPLSKTFNGLETEIPNFTTTATDHAAYLAEDEANAGIPMPFRFGAEKEVNVNFSNSGQWETLGTGDRIWRLEVVSEGALSLNFIFENFNMPTGATFHIHNEHEVMGAYTSANNAEDGAFATYLIKGERATFEYYEPASVAGQGTMGLKTIVHGYRDVINPENSAAAGGSGACNINVACANSAGWEDQINGVARLIVGGGLCSGSMISDVPESGTPYLLTADHCVDGANPSNYVFLFNYQAADCNGNTGPTNQTVNGSVLRANNSGSDVALLELNTTPPASFGIFYAGWTRNTAPADETVCIHHPSGDIKKFSRDYQSPQSATWSGAQVWDVNWNEGVTEGGSSGSPLFDENHRIVGQLFGGSSSCAFPNGADVYGKFNVSWDGPNSASRLKDWLDPANTNVTSVDGWDPNASEFELDAGIPSVLTVEDGGEICGTNPDIELLLENDGNETLTTVTINWEIDNVPQTPFIWTGSLEFTEEEIVNLGSASLSVGSHTIEFVLTSPNGGLDENGLNNTITVTFDVAEGHAVLLELKTDAFPEHTTWDLFDDMSNLVLSSNPYTDQTTLHEQILCLSDGCYEFTIYDSGNNGICCNTGSGFYLLEDSTNAPMIGGGDFDSEETQGFCLPFVAPLPDALFSSNHDSICEGESIIFTNLSSPSVGVTRSWIFEGGSPSTSTSNQPLITYNTPGVFDVTLIATNATGSDTLLMEDAITVCDPTGIHEFENSRFSIYPNPSAETVTIQLIDRMNVDQVSLIDMTGRVVVSQSWDGTDLMRLNIADLNNGTYSVSINTPEGRLNKRLTIIH